MEKSHTLPTHLQEAIMMFDRARQHLSSRRLARLRKLRDTKIARHFCKVVRDQ